MKLGLISDIHSNHRALAAVLDSIKQHYVDKLLIAGDFVGYYFWPAEVLQLLQTWSVVAVRGNHERMLECAGADYDYLAEIEKKYGTGIRVALDNLAPDQIDWLTSLPDSLEFDTEDGKILLCHGSPWDVDEYVYPDAGVELQEKYAALDFSWVVQGHTHYPMVKKIHDVTAINPGAVGQPRNRQPGAHWALLDTKSRQVEHFCEQYDIGEVIKESQKRHPELPYLSQILERR